ncbi:MAG: hypothetical protein ACE5KZ_13470 [Candidatus Scalinduaceae bacterium]
MSYRYFYLSLFFLVISSKIYGDTLGLINFDEQIDAKIVEVNEEFVKVVIPQREIGTINFKSELDDKYPDSVFVNANGKEHKVVCKIVKMSKEPGSITVNIPRQKVSSIQIAFPGSEHDLSNNQKKTLNTRKEHLPVDVDRLKEQIKEELRLEFEKKQNKEDVVFEEKIKEELRLEFEEKQQMEEEIYETENFGKVKGRMLFKGKPLPGCRVKIVKLEKWGFLGKIKESLKFETITDENGRCHFEKIPPGGYKLYWKPPAESSWIRRLRMEPDIYVEAGETYYLPDRETHVRTLN